MTLVKDDKAAFIHKDHPDRCRDPEMRFCKRGERMGSTLNTTRKRGNLSLGVCGE